MESRQPCHVPDPIIALATQLQTSLESLRVELAGAESLMKVLQGRIFSIQEALDVLNIAELQIKPEATTPPKRRRTNLTGPVQLLSQDVLFLIFQYAIHMDSPTKPSRSELSISMAFRKADPWNYAAVCRRWRGVCLSCPLVWKRITHWEIPPSYRGLLGLQAYRNTMQLRRSGTSPLIGRMDGIETRMGVHPPEHELAALRGIISAFPRFTALELRGEIPANILPNHETNFTSLESLLIDGRWWLRDSGLTAQKAPGLRSLTLCGMPVLSSNTTTRPYYDLSVCWTSITTLDLSHIGSNTIHLQDLMRILHLTTYVRSLGVSGDSIVLQATHWHEERVTACVTLASLRSLRIVHLSGSRSAGPELREFLAQLRAPNLRTLNTGGSMPNAGNALLPFIQKSGVATSITSLSISISVKVIQRNSITGYVTVTRTARSADIRSLFPELQGLRYLHIYGLNGRSSEQGPAVLALLQILTWPIGDHTTVEEAARVCPDLEEIHCLTGWKTMLDVPWRELRRLVQSRITHTPHHGLIDRPNPIDIASIPDQHKPERKASRVQVLSLVELSREMGGKVLQQLDEEDRSSMRWLIDAAMSGVFKLRLQDIEGEV